MEHKKETPLYGSIRAAAEFLPQLRAIIGISRTFFTGTRAGRKTGKRKLHRSFDAGCKLIYSTQINVWEKPYVFSNVDKFFPQWLDREYNWAEETKREGLGAWGL